MRAKQTAYTLERDTQRVIKEMGKVSLLWRLIFDFDTVLCYTLLEVTNPSLRGEGCCEKAG